MANITITQLPSAGAITGTELVPIVQNGVTVQTTTAALAGSPVQTQTFLTLNQEPTLANSRRLSAGTGVGLTDGGAQAALQITLNAASGSLEAAGTGMIAKTASNTVAGRTMTATTSGISVTNGDGVAGAPAFALTGVALAVAGATGTGVLALNSSSTIATRTILGTSSQIDVTDGNFVNSPVIAISSDPTVPGAGGIVIPAGTTGQRGTSTNGTLRYNTTTATFEGYANSAWGSIVTGTGVTSVATGTGLTGGPITSTGTISIDVTGVAAATYGSSLVVPVIAVNAQGQITSATNTTINAVTLITGTISTTPSGSTDIANKSYVDTVAQGLDTKASVVAATTANITLSGAQTIDGISVVAADRVLVKNQTLSQNNGLYLCASGAWTRTTDMNTWAQVPGAYVFVETGTTLADTGWVCTSDAGGTLGTTAITWAQFSGAGSGVSSITFGTTGLTPATATTGAVTVAGTLAVANGGTGLTAGTSGGVLAYTATGTLASSAALTANAIVLGGGAGAVPAVLGSLGTTTTVLHGNAGGAPTFGAVSLTADVSGTLPIANGGTNSTATATAGGSAYGTGTAFAFTAAGTAGQVLTSAGASAPVWSGIAGGTF